MVINSYTELSGHYDRIMTSGYYDYDDYARALLTLVGDRRRLLELGTGTGLVVQKLLDQAATDLDITGIDHTGSMLAQARARLGGRARFLLQDILDTDLPPASFDMAFSVGGIWLFTPGDGPDDTVMCSHLLEDADNVKGLENVHAAVRPGGRLVLSAQAPHRDYERPLPGGLVYAQRIQRVPGGRIVKDYYVKRPDGTVEAHQHCEYRVHTADEAERLLTRCGFRFERVSEDRLFHVYGRLPA
ncbi:class I SAM-dependent methyltransferase [Streptomyces sp. NPDC059063]|uniref:class I SAM-dependent methyltransferase n=1 Tax=unclassified Streptomyces TaxID=2593676 RepID=UPI0036C4F93B